MLIGLRLKMGVRSLGGGGESEWVRWIGGGKRIHVGAAGAGVPGE